MKKRTPALLPALIDAYIAHLREQERSPSTLRKYARDLAALLKHLDGRTMDKAALIGWKHHLAETYAPSSVNTMLAAVNGYLAFMGWRELTVKPLRIQKALFLDEHRELTQTEYFRLVRTAEQRPDRRLALVLQVLCATGIRVSELRFITVEAVAAGRTEVSSKGKRRTVFLPDKLRRLLRRYIQAQKKTAGAVFTTRTGKALDRSNIWRDMKALCGRAGVDPKKVFPHNLRHLFARTYYELEKDLSRLADLLGHSSISTTRIYTAESGIVHARQLERMGLVVT